MSGRIDRDGGTATRAGKHAAGKRSRPKRVDCLGRGLDELTSIVSHELKEPLRGIGAYCDLVLEDFGDKLGEDGRRRLHAIEKMSARLQTMIDGLLTYYRVGRVRRARSRVDLHAVVDQVLDTLQPWIDRRGARVRVVGPLPQAAVDATLWGMVFRNLISNGLKFNNHARPTVEIGALPGRPATIYVRDNGIGIRREHHAAVFNVFRRLHSRREYEGTGLGLAIVRKIIESHGGKVWVESEPGLGCTFHFTLGAAAAWRSVPARTGRQAAKPPAQPPHWGKAHKRGPATPSLAPVS